MPNHIKNVLKFKNLKPEEKEFILSEFTEKLKDIIYPLNCVFDFDKIIPEPRSESECPEDCKVNKDSHIAEDKERPWFNWYKWHIKYWGTKWGAYDSYVQIGKSYITFVFSTAWSAPFPIYEQLQKEYPAFQFEVKFADEDWGSNCGRIIWDGKYFIKYLEKDLSDPVQFARRLWNNY